MYKLGILGFGIVGKSILSFLSGQRDNTLDISEQQIIDEAQDSNDIKVCVWDARTLDNEEKGFIASYGARVLDGASVSLETFIKEHDFIIVSPGVNLDKYRAYTNKFLCELDFFSDFFKTPVVAVSGSLGKTTTTKLIGNIISRVRLACGSKNVFGNLLALSDHFKSKDRLRPLVGGNVGVGMLNFVKQQRRCDIGILELSSFQLELNRKFAPDVAIWTNFYPNHLDRHSSLEEYFEAKFNLIRYQNERQAALFSLSMFEGDGGAVLNKRVSALKSTVCVCTHQKLSPSLVKLVNKESFYVFFIEDEWLKVASVHCKEIAPSEKIFNMHQLPDMTFKQNWVQVLATLYILGVDMGEVFKILHDDKGATLLDDFYHRIEHFTTIKGVDFYNDSKSTITQATELAVEKLLTLNRPIILIVGGLCKGVDRKPFMKNLSAIKLIKKIYCFGSECSDFCNYCSSFDTFEEVVRHVFSIMEPGSLVLFSPGGSSFDLFKSYEHRGRAFKELVKKFGREEIDKLH